MRHRLCDVSTYELSDLSKGHEHPAFTPVKSGTYTLPLV